MRWSTYYDVLVICLSWQFYKKEHHHLNLITIGMVDLYEFECMKLFNALHAAEGKCRPLEYQMNYMFMMRSKLFPMLTRYFNRYGVVLLTVDFEGWIKGSTSAEESISTIHSKFEELHGGSDPAYSGLARVKASADHGHPAGEYYSNISKMLSDLSKLVQLPYFQFLVQGCFNMMDSMITMQDFH